MRFNENESEGNKILFLLFDRISDEFNNAENFKYSDFEICLGPN